MDIEFKSLNELYKRVKPALISKKHELRQAGYNYIKEEDIWNYLRKRKWQKTIDLSLSELINDILSIEGYMVDNYIKQEMKTMPREANINED